MSLKEIKKNRGDWLEYHARRMVLGKRNRGDPIFLFFLPCFLK